jgi:uncharacterized protein
MIEQNEILKKTEKYVYALMSDDISGHDWWHIYRVRRLAMKISGIEGGNKFIIEMATLLHDVDDWKLKKENQHKSIAESWLLSLFVHDFQRKHILGIIDEVSFKGNSVPDTVSSIEAKIVQDADRLDAIGAIGIARAFAYGGSKLRPIYDPGQKPGVFHTFDEYKSNNGTTINHFYEKLLLLKDRMNTPTGKLMAEERHLYMVKFLQQFFIDWEVE